MVDRKASDIEDSKKEIQYPHSETVREIELALNITPEISDTFNKWQAKRWFIGLMLWLGPVIAIVVTAILFAIGYFQEQEESVDSLQTGIVYALIAGGIAFFIIKEQWSERREVRKNLSRGACIYAGYNASRSLGENHTVTASLFVELMLHALSDLLRVRSVKAGSYKVSARKAMYVIPKRIPKKAVFHIIQTPENRPSFKQKLDELLKRLILEENIEYEAAQDFLVWLDTEVDSVRKESETFFDRHPVVLDTLKVLPVVATGIGALIGALTQLIRSFI